MGESTLRGGEVKMGVERGVKNKKRRGTNEDQGLRKKKIIRE